MQVIDKREERLVSRSRAWVSKLMEDNNLCVLETISIKTDIYVWISIRRIEKNRNHAKLAEIHDFIEKHRIDYSNFVENLGE